MADIDHMKVTHLCHRITHSCDGAHKEHDAGN